MMISKEDSLCQLVTGINEYMEYIAFHKELVAAAFVSICCLAAGVACGGFCNSTLISRALSKKTFLGKYLGIYLPTYLPTYLPQDRRIYIWKC